MSNPLISTCFAELTQSTLPLTLPAKGVAVDSRLIKPGEIFFALPGEKVDGHRFVEAAALKGAILCVVAENYAGPEVLPLVRVKDPLMLLQNVASAVLSRSKAKVVAITGSVGKTTTKNFIAHLLSKRFKIAASPGNSNSQIGLPLTILNHTIGDEEIVVLEMGMTESGQIRKLVEIAPPDIAVLTSVGLVHACNFDSIEEIAWAKAEILSHEGTQLGIIARDIPIFDDIFNQCKFPSMSFSCENTEADYSVENPYDGLMKIRFGKEIIDVEKFPLAGKHNRHNFLAASIVARHFGISWNEIIEQAKTLVLPEKRGHISEKYGIKFVDDSYNASPLSVKAALMSLPKPKSGGRKIAVLGAMLELGEFSEQCHREVGECAFNSVDILLCLGDECSSMLECWKRAGKPAELYYDRDVLVNRLRGEMKAGDVVLLKGSLSTGIHKIFDEL